MPDLREIPILGDIIRFIQSIVDWVTSLPFWNAYEPPQLWALITAFAVVLLCLIVPPAWHLARNAVTIVHEMGHVTMAFLMRRRISGIKLHSDTSGLAITRGKPSGIGILLVSISGYTAPGIVGVLLVWASYAGHSGVGVLLLTVLVGLAFLLARNVFGFLITSVSLLLLIWALFDATPVVLTSIALIVGIFLATGSFRASLDLISAHSNGQGSSSDAASAARHSGIIPTIAWLGFFLIFTALCALQAVLLAFGYSIFTG